MNLLLIIVVLVLVCAYGSNLGLNLPCPSMIKSNKQLLLGVVVGLVLSSQFGFNICWAVFNSSYDLHLDVL